MFSIILQLPSFSDIGIQHDFYYSLLFFHNNSSLSTHIKKKLLQIKCIGCTSRWWKKLFRVFFCLVIVLLSIMIVLQWKISLQCFCIQIVNFFYIIKYCIKNYFLISHNFFFATFFSTVQLIWKCVTVLYFILKRGEKNLK